MDKNSTSYRFLNALKQLLIATLLGLILYFFMIPIGTQLSWVTPVMQLLLISMFTCSVYIPFWEYGDRDNNLVLFNKRDKDMLFGLKLSSLVIIPYFVSSVLLLLYRLGVPSWTLLIYRIVNVQFIYIIDYLINIETASATPWLSIVVCMLLPLYTVLVASVAYILGYKQISIKEKLIYKSKWYLSFETHKLSYTII